MPKKNKEILIYLGYIAVSIIVIVAFIITNESFLDNEGQISSSSDVLWPMLISLVITLMGTLITTYVFLKESLDRTVDEKPYYDTIICKYRNKIMKYLWHYSLITLFLIIFVVFLYAMLYFLKIRSIIYMRVIVLAAYIILILFTIPILRFCIDIDKGLYKLTKNILREQQEEAYKLIKNLHSIGASNVINVIGSQKTIEQWLEIDGKEEFSDFDIEKFINKFSKWEKILMLLIEKDDAFFSKQSLSEQIRLSACDSESLVDGKGIIKIEEDDAKENRWEQGAYNQMKVYQNMLQISGEDFSKIYTLLSEYRNLLQVQLEKNEKGLQKISRTKEIKELFVIFLMYMYTKIFIVLPKIEVFLPNARFQYTNFYSTRFENSAFRMSFFECTVFSRSKINNSNFNSAYFGDCQFYSIDSRDCSFSNTMFKNSNLKDSIFENVDFTGMHMLNCKLEKAKFSNSILSNLEIKETVFYRNDFSNSKIWDVGLTDIENNSIRECNFLNCDLHNIKFYPYNSEKNKKQIYDKKEHSNFYKFITDNKVRKFYWEDSQIIIDIEKIIDDFVPINFKSKEEFEKNKKLLSNMWNEIKNIVLVQMQECIFENAVMQEFKFYRVNIEQSIFVNTQMSESHFIGVYMPGCIMKAANMRSSKLCGVYMRSSVLDEAILYKAICKMVNFEDGSMVMLHTSGTKIFYCSFERSDCSNMDLTESELQKVSFKDCILKNIELTYTKLIEVNFENAIGNNILSSYSNFYECMFLNAYMEDSYFNYTVFKNCDFKLADFSKSTITNVTFYSCNFKGANFKECRFINVIFKDNDNLETEIFENGSFINSEFQGKNKNFEFQLSDVNINNYKV